MNHIAVEKRKSGPELLRFSTAMWFMSAMPVLIDSSCRVTAR
jgi:hypothetical protein